MFVIRKQTNLICPASPTNPNRATCRTSHADCEERKRTLNPNDDANQTRRDRMIYTVRRYFEACNAADPAIFAQVLTEDCLLYFPPETGGPYVGRDAIVELWRNCVRDLGSVWSIDRLVCDGVQLVVEWTHFKPEVGEFIRGSQWYEFDHNERLTAIWAHYASPRDTNRVGNELEGFPYEQCGYKNEAPQLSEAELASRAHYAAQVGS